MSYRRETRKIRDRKELKIKVEAVEMAQQVKCSLSKYEDQGLDSGGTHKRQVGMGHTCNPSTAGTEQGIPEQAGRLD